MTRDWKKSYVCTSVLIVSDVMPTDETSTYLPFQEIRPWGPTWTILVDAQSALKTTGLDLIMLNCGCIIVEVWGSLGWFHIACIWFNMLLGCIFVIVILLCPLLYRVSPVYNLAILSSAC